MNKNSIYNIYLKFILILSFLFILFRIPSYIHANIKLIWSCIGEWSWALCLLNIAEMLRAILFMCVTAHIVVLLIKMLTKKGEHSFIWLIWQEGAAIIVPILAVGFMRFFENFAYERAVEVFWGIVAGVISSLIVLILNRNKNLVEKLLQSFAPEFSENAKSNIDKPIEENLKKPHEEKLKIMQKHF